MKNVLPLFITLFLLSLSQLLTSCAENTVVPVVGESFYSTEIQPIMTASCAFSGCHGGGSALSGIKLDTYADVMASNGAVLGKMVIPGNVSGSPLVQVIEGTANGVSQMPLGGSLSAEQISRIKEWIQNGATND